MNEISMKTGTKIIDDTINKLKQNYPLEFLFYNVFEPYGSNNLAEANIYSNTITFSPKLFDNNIGTGYKLEAKIIQKHNLNQEEFIKWIVCHEYTHIYYKINKHRNKFFQLVEEMFLSLCK
jgi:hypothetical protein